MKILVCRSAGGASFAASGGADSALLREGEPVFIEEPASGWTSDVVLALRISRLGTHIPEKFAGRYFDAVSAVHRIVPAPETDAAVVPPFFRDRAFAPGKWIPLDGSDGDFALSVCRRSHDGATVTDEYHAVFSPDALGGARIVAWLSEYMTLKTGDIVVLADTSVALGVPVINSCVEAKINNMPSLSVRIK